MSRIPTAGPLSFFAVPALRARGFVVPLRWCYAYAFVDDLRGMTNLHVVFTSECNNKQFDWFTVGVFESFRASGMRGHITRLLACDEADLKDYKGLDLGPTFVRCEPRFEPTATGGAWGQ